MEWFEFELFLFREIPNLNLMGRGLKRAYKELEIVVRFILKQLINVQLFT